MFFLTFILLSWINDELDLFIITDQRIIGIEQVSSLSRRVSECGLDRVQEVNAEVTGIFQTVLHYGHVHIHTASENSDMIVSYAPNPVENGNRINTIISEYRSHRILTRTQPV
ncbi:PH domain-containing protein [Candidatus Gracilibacteria bacterium]|nr:PH domain-containing protein [Candidatus Gracilibacteria bacterium]